MDRRGPEFGGTNIQPEHDVDRGNIKSAMRHLVAKAASATGLIGSRERAVRDHVTILCYHRVLPDEQRRAYHDPDLVVTPEVLRAQCRVLAERYTVATLGAALAAEPGPRHPARPLAVITFDDGYRDNVFYAAPILREAGLTATFFVVAGLVDTERLPWYDIAGGALQALQRSGRMTGPTPKEAVSLAKAMPPAERQAWIDGLVRDSGPIESRTEDQIMTSDQVRGLVAAGHEVGSHSMTHPLLPQCSDEELDFEVSASRERLGNIVGRSIESFCYPNGDWDDRTVAAVRKAGYACATTMQPGLNPGDRMARFDLKRWFIDQGRLTDKSGRPSNELLRMKLCGLVK